MLLFSQFIGAGFITSSPLLEGGKVSNTRTGSWFHSSGEERSSVLQVERRLLRCFQDALSDTSLRVLDKLLEDKDLGIEETGQEECLMDLSYWPWSLSGILQRREFIPENKLFLVHHLHQESHRTSVCSFTLLCRLC